MGLAHQQWFLSAAPHFVEEEVELVEGIDRCGDFELGGSGGRDDLELGELVVGEGRLDRSGWIEDQGLKLLAGRCDWFEVEVLRAEVENALRPLGPGAPFAWQLMREAARGRDEFGIAANEFQGVEPITGLGDHEHPQ